MGQNSLGERGGIRFYFPLPGESVRTDVHRQHSLLHEKTGIVVAYTPGVPNQDVVSFE